MKSNFSFLILGGDIRQKYLYYEMLNNGFNVLAYGVPNIEESKKLSELILATDYIILPIPFSKDGKSVNSIKMPGEISLDSILLTKNTGFYLIGGCLSPDFTKQLKENNIEFSDFMDNSTFELNNSIATAEGAIAQAISSSSINLHRRSCLILGFGKCAKAIAARLNAFNCNICVCARNKYQQTEAFVNGYESISLLELSQIAGHFDFIFNTIPAQILTRNVLKTAKSEVTIIDIASCPGGTDFNACRQFGLNAGLYLGLPGKYAPKTSCEIMLDCIKSTFSSS